MVDNRYLDALRMPGMKWSHSPITYYFVPGGPSDDDSSRDWRPYEEQALRAALQAWEAVANLHFQEIHSPDANLMEHLKSEIGFAYGTHYTPDKNGSAPDDQLDGAFSLLALGNTKSKWEPGSRAFWTLLHELGHGIGLAHPFEDELIEGSPGFPGTYPLASGDNGLARTVHTVMGYVQGWEGGGPDYNGVPITPMAFDIKAIQDLYGANMETGMGDTIYRLTDDNVGFICIWDVSGSDQIRYDSARPVSIDLRSATLENSPIGGGVFSSVAGRTGGFSIAHGVVIENAQSGSSHDYLAGNSADNTLVSGAGNDKVLGRGGNDILVGGANNDTLRGGLGDDSINGGNGNDILRGDEGADILLALGGDDNMAGGLGDDLLSGGDGNDAMSGQTGNDRLFGNGGNDTLIGGSGLDKLYGQAGSDQLRGDAGHDTVVGGGGKDILFGGAGDDLLKGGTGQDRLRGGAGTDRLYGNQDADILSGEAGKDHIYGEGGADRLNGGAGQDRLIGGSGNDLMTGGGGRDYFDGGAGRDQVDWRHWTGAATVDLVAGTAEFTGAYTETVIRVEDVLLGAGHDRVSGSEVANRVHGGGGDDFLYGAQGADILLGGAGNDILRGGADQDYLDGGPGIDTADWTTATALCEVDLAAETATFIGYYTETVKNVENVLMGYARDVVLGSSDANLINGNAGNDTLNGKGGDDGLYGGTGLDYLIGDTGDDTLSGGADDDWLTAGEGDDDLRGGAGNDNLDGGAGNDSITGGSGVDNFVFNDGCGTDRIIDFMDGTDVLRLNNSLWSGALSRAQVVASFASVLDADVVFDFGGGDRITLSGFGALGAEALIDDIVLI